MAAVYLESHCAMHKLIISIIESNNIKNILSPNEMELLKTDLEMKELKINNIEIVQKYLTMSNATDQNIVTYLTNCKVKFQKSPDNLQLLQNNSNDIIKRRKFLNEQHEKREYNRMIFGTEKYICINTYMAYIVLFYILFTLGH